MLTAISWGWVEQGLGLLNELTGFTTLVAEYRAVRQGWVGEVALRSLAGLLLVAGTLAASLRLVHLTLPRVGVPLRWASILGVGMWFSTVGFHLLRGVGAFNLFFALLACGGLLALAAAPGRAPLALAIRRERRAAAALLRLFRRGGHGFVVSLFAGLAAVVVLRSLVIPPLGWDTLTYHGTRAALWLQSGQFTFEPGPGPFDLYRHFFGGSEVLTAWAMLPFHSDLLVNLCTCVQWFGVGLAAWALGRGLGLREPFASTGAGVVMFLPTLQLEVGSGYVEVALQLALLLGIAMAVHCLRRPDVPALLVAAGALGLATGIKIQGALPGALVFAVLALRWLVVGRQPPWRRLGWLAAAIACACLPALPWIYQAWQETGYPLSPMPIELFGITLGESGPALTWYQDHPELTPFVWAAEKEALLSVFAPVGTEGEALGTPALIALLALPFGFVSLMRRRASLALLIGSASLIPLAVHFSPALSVPRLLWPMSMSRYLITFMALVIPLGLAWCRPGWWPAQAYRRLLLAYPLLYGLFGLRWGWGAWEYRELTLLVIGLVLLATVVRWSLRRSRRTAAVVAIAALVVACSFLQFRRDVTRSRAFAESFALHGFIDYWAVAVPLVDTPDRRHEIAVTGGPTQASDEWCFYAFLGSRFQNRVHYVPPTRDGGIAHFGPRGDLASRADVQRWNERLVERGVTQVLSFWPRSIEQDWMERDPRRFRKLAGDANWGLFQRQP